jgi:hypothetical protein
LDDCCRDSLPVSGQAVTRRRLAPRKRRRRQFRDQQALKDIEARDGIPQEAESQLGAP